MRTTLAGLADALRSAGLTVVEMTPRHVSRRTWRFRSLIVHHDASPVGPSRSLASYLYRQAVKGKPSSQLWIDYDGVVYIITHGWAAHAGVVFREVWRNDNSLGIETDHTTGERWPEVQLRSLITTCAVTLKWGGWPVTDETLSFHKLIAKPLGRKVDPDGIDYQAFADQVRAYSEPSRPVGLLSVDGRFGPKTVSLLQRALKYRGLYHGEIDGSFGPMTRRALQAMLGVVRDGQIGPRTCSALQRLMGMPVTGRWTPSLVKRLQAWLNGELRAGRVSR